MAKESAAKSRLAGTHSTASQTPSATGKIRDAVESVPTTRQKSSALVARASFNMRPRCVELARVLKKTIRPHWVMLLATLCVAELGYSQGTIHNSFEGRSPGTSIFVQQYLENGMWCRPLGVVGPGNGFSHARGGGQLTFAPDNGTAYLKAALGDSLAFSFLDGTTFSLVSVDLAEFSTGYPEPFTVPFIGYRADGTIVTMNHTTDGVIDGSGPIADFQTFYFNKEWTGLERVEIPIHRWSLDNLVVVVPEPSACVLLLIGGLGFWTRRLHKST